MVWFIGGGVPFLMLAARTLGVGARFNVEVAWGWLLPAILPTLSLMIGVIASGESPGKGEIDSFQFRLAWWLSLIYLSLVTASLLATWLNGSDLNTFKVFLGPIQGLVAGLLAFFFGRARSASKTTLR
jgi:hypothetical protein